MSSKSSGLFFGIVLGGVATWWILAGASAPESASSGPATGLARNDFSPPPPLAIHSAADAIAAWLAWRAPAGPAPGYAAQVDRLRALLLRLPQEAFPRLLDPLFRADDRHAARLRSVAFAAWVEKEPAAAARWAAGREGGEELLQLAREAAAAWAELDPRSASVWACAVPDARIARDLAGVTLARLAAVDPGAVLALAASRGDGFRADVLTPLVSALGAKDPAGTIHTFGPPLWEHGKGVFILLDTLRTWARQDPSATATWLLAQPRRSSGDLTNCLINFQKVGPAWHRAISDALLTLPAGADRTQLVTNAVSTWRTTQPAEALAWLKNLPNDDLRLTLLERVIRSSIEQPDQDLALIAALPEGALRDEQIARRLARWASEKPDAALAWIRAHESQPGVAEASASVHVALLGELARESPRLAIAELQNLSDPRARQTVVFAIADSWSKEDPAAAFQWMMGEQEKAGRIIGESGKPFERWAKNAPEDALRWVEDWFVRQPQVASAFGDTYLAAFAKADGQTAPRASTADLYAKIRDPQLRFQTLKRHVANWLAKDPAAARAWVDASPVLSPGQQAEILTQKL